MTLDEKIGKNGNKNSKVGQWKSMYVLEIHLKDF